MQEDTSVCIFVIISCMMIFILGFILGIASKTNDNRDIYRTLYCQSFKATQQYVDCMSKPLEDTLKELKETK